MLLVIDTATAACSVALIADGEAVHAARELVGRGHAERLVPMIAELLRDAGGVRPSAILVDCGPGSFTGVRVGLAAALGLGIGWGVPVRGLFVAGADRRCRFAAIRCWTARGGARRRAWRGVRAAFRRPSASPPSPISPRWRRERAALAPEAHVAGSGNSVR